MPHPPSEPASGQRRRLGAKKPQRLLWLGASLAGTGVIALFAGQAWIESYLKGEPFRSRAEATVGKTLHAEAKLAPLRRQGTTLAADALELNGHSESFVQKAELQGVLADIDLGGLWHRTWKVETIHFQRVVLALKSTGQATSRDIDAQNPAPPPPQPTWLEALLPNKTQIGALQTDRATITREGVELHETRLSAKPLEGGWDLALEAGELKAGKLPAMELTQARIVTQADGGVLRSARLLVKSGGQVIVTGDWRNTPEANLHAQLENIELAPFLPTWWQAHLHGQIVGTLHFLQNAQKQAGELTGDLRLTHGQIEALPLLTQLGAFLGNPRFRQVPLKTASARLYRTPTRTELQDLDLDGDGVVRIRGNVIVENQHLSGSLRLGISSSLTQWLPATQSKIFTESKDGYIWVPFELSGTMEQPQENLSQKLITGAVENVTEAMRNLPAKLPEAVPDTAKGLLDAVKSLLPKK